jgi:hypothetical protein
MIRVTEPQEGVRTIITLDGQLPGDYIEVVEICCNQAVPKGKPIDVFLHDVLTIGESGRALLTRLAAKGVRLLATGPHLLYRASPHVRRNPGTSLSVGCSRHQWRGNKSEV